MKMPKTAKASCLNPGRVLLVVCIILPEILIAQTYSNLSSLSLGEKNYIRK